MPLATIPAEIQEAIILETAILSPRTISSLSQTCRALYRLISKPNDQHLWRRIFLAIFDDPRPALRLDPHTHHHHHKVVQKRKKLVYQSRNNSSSGDGNGEQTTGNTTIQEAVGSISINAGAGGVIDAVELDWKRETQRRFRAKIRMETVATAAADMDEFDGIVDEDVVDALMDLAMFALPASGNEQDVEEELASGLTSKRLEDEEEDEGEGEGEEEGEEEDREEEEDEEWREEGDQECEEGGQKKKKNKGKEGRRGNTAYLEDCLRSTILPAPTTQKLAKLHILCSFLKVHTSVSIPIATYLIGFRTRGSRLRLESRAYTYNLSNYKEENHYGPWLPSSSSPSSSSSPGGGDDDRMEGVEVMARSDEDAVNWIHLWHLINVVRYNSYERNSFELPTIGIDGWRAFSAPKTTHRIREPPEEEEKEYGWNDWAGVQGIWCRAISFMDYRDLHSYNFTDRNLDGSLRPTIFEQVQFAEAFRLIKAYFTVIKVEEVGPAHHPDRPRIHFVGDTALFTHPAHAMSTLGGGNGANAQDASISIHRITKGTVSMTPAGAVRWSFSTRVGGHEWASEGTQIGQVQSRAGVVGVWTSAEHEDGDPAGPFWMWRIGEKRPKMKKLEGPNVFHYHFIFQDD